MDVFDLFGKISLDTSGFENALKTAIEGGKNLAASLGNVVNISGNVQKGVSAMSEQYNKAAENVKKSTTETEKNAESFENAADSLEEYSEKSEEATESSEKLIATESEIRSMVMKLAHQFEKSGMDKSKAMKKANEEIRSQYTKTAEEVEKSSDKINKSQKETSKESEKDSKDFVKNWDSAAEGLKSIAGKIKNALETAAKVGAAAVGVASSGLGVLLKQSVDSYANYEQLVGGVDTLFKESSAKVQQYADQAYRTAGMSANEYMETVTSFSASLLQGLDKDTDKAADVANQAMVDMSDNANKMGTDIASIQNAYQGFAKQNYTMLDNLKLGKLHYCSV